MKQRGNMGILHYLNVLEGDCSIIQHPSGHYTIIDVNNAGLDKKAEMELLLKKALAERAGVLGNFNQKEYPVNPISYLQSFGVNSIFRFILTHPDMDHMGGIEDFFSIYCPLNFWDTDNCEEKDFEGTGPYNENDWKFYKKLRDNPTTNSPKRLTLLAGARGQYYNQNEDGSNGGDGLFVLAPTNELISDANATSDFNSASYVILYQSEGGKILFCGDSHDKTWEYILDNHMDDVTNIDLLIAPHHGRASDRSYKFLDITKPTLTFFGNAASEDLAYDAWKNRGLPIVTNNQANCMIVDCNVNPMRLYVTNEKYAQKVNADTVFEQKYKAYYCFEIK
jgi:competence protein ComEC